MLSLNRISENYLGIMMIFYGKTLILITQSINLTYNSHSGAAYVFEGTSVAQNEISTWDSQNPYKDREESCVIHNTLSPYNVVNSV